jgi:hypothetical protein
VSHPQLTYPVHGGCVYCTYELDRSEGPDGDTLQVSPATNRVQTRNGPRDLCPDHAREVTEIEPKRFPWEGPIPPRLP